MKDHERIFAEAIEWQARYPLSAKSRKELVQLARALETVAACRESGVVK